jgi:putative zinc finger protein
MRCKDVNSVLAGFALEELPSSEHQQVEQHLHGCEACSQELVEIQDALGLMNAWVPEEPSPELVARTLSALEAERTGPKSLEERYHNFVHWLMNLQITPARGVLATALGVCLFVMLHNFGQRPTIVSALGVSQCQKNLTDLRKASESFRDAHNGELPAEMEALYPDYISEPPICPSAGIDTYSEGFEANSETSELVIYCSGHHHSDEGLDPNEPRVSLSSSVSD